MLFPKNRSPWLVLSVLLLSCGGNDPTPPVPPPPPPELDARIADCLRINACEAEGGQPMGMQACLGHVLDEPWTWAATGTLKLEIESLDCKLAAKDCAAVRACTPPKDTFTTACAAHPADDLCEGETWVLCDPDGKPTAAMDCAAAGLSCHKGIWAGCGKETCTFGTTKTTCAADDPDVLVECTPAGVLERIDCRTQYNMVHINGQDGEKRVTIAGETCGFDKQRNDIGCIGTGEDCGFFSQACNGDVLETCAGGKIGRRDCATLSPEGQSCGFVQSGEFAGGAACGFVEPTCDLGGAESCEGSTLSFCDLGSPAKVDCEAQGFSGCATATLGGRTVAYCAP